jgi:hypothetical protein
MFRRLTLTILVALITVACSSNESTDSADERLLALLDDPATLHVPGAPEDYSWPPELVQEIVAQWDSVGTETALRFADPWCESTKGYESGEEWMIDLGESIAAGESGFEWWVELGEFSPGWIVPSLGWAIPQAEYCDSPTQNRLVAEGVGAIANLGQVVAEKLGE